MALYNRDSRFRASLKLLCMTGVVLAMFGSALAEVVSADRRRLILGLYVKAAFVDRSGQLLRTLPQAETSIDIVCTVDSCREFAKQVAAILPNVRFRVNLVADIEPHSVVTVVLLDSGQSPSDLEILRRRVFELKEGESISSDSSGQCASFTVFRKPVVSKAIVVMPTYDKLNENIACFLLMLAKSTGLKFNFSLEELKVSLTESDSNTSRSMLMLLVNMLMIHFSPDFSPGMTRAEFRNKMMSLTDKDLYGE